MRITTTSAVAVPTYEGEVVAFSGDSLWIDRPDRIVLSSHAIEQIEVRTGPRRVLRAALIGAGAGAALGAIAQLIVGADQGARPALRGAAFGGILGLGIGAFRRGERWEIAEWPTETLPPGVGGRGGSVAIGWAFRVP
ncbi:MAG: hypothetical protein OEU54_12485 [Gemmatimonadota bacterium]|nr:hypothetical protein [Gemmatimonadota bacterium]